jgi:hypothetical protein
MPVVGFCEQALQNVTDFLKSLKSICLARTSLLGGASSLFKKYVQCRIHLFQCQFDLLVVFPSVLNFVLETSAMVV